MSCSTGISNMMHLLRDGQPDELTPDALFSMRLNPWFAQIQSVIFPPFMKIEQSMTLKERIAGQPISKMIWVLREELSANLYNPNKMAPPEKELLVRSIVDDGWLFPICVLPKGTKVEGLTAAEDKYTIIDGFHRYLISEVPEVWSLTDGYVPIVQPWGSDFIATTVRMNRIKGTHTVMGMADIVRYLLENGRTAEYIMQEYGMEAEEVYRLANRNGIPKTDIIHGTDFSKSWKPGALDTAEPTQS